MSSIVVIVITVSYVKEYDKAMESIGEEEEVYLEHLTGNPITAFLLMRRLYVDWQPIKTLIDKETANGMKHHIK